MARRYEAEELLLLRDSPLAVKPDSLPPAEEWMGPIADATAQKKHTVSRDQPNQSESTGRRPSLFETRHISRTSNSEELVLGPPKTSFASATRGFGKSFDASDKSFSRINDDEPRNDRYNFRDKFFRDKEFGDKDRDRDSERRDMTRPSLANGRRAGRDDREDWSSGRPRRTFGQEDTDRRIKRGDSDRWEGRGDPRDHRDNHQDGGNDRHNRDSKDGRYPPRRDAQGRGRHDQNWFREGDGQDLGDNTEAKTPVRHREWRRGLHGQERDWNRATKQEQDPEWMDPSDRQEPRESHTQEDFQRWKERMKAGSNQVSDEVKKDTLAEEPKVEAKAADEKRVDGEMFSRLDSSFQMDTGMDNFFGLWGEHKTNQDVAPDATPSDNVVKDTPTAARPAKASRFAGIFNAPQDGAKVPEPAPAEPERPASTDADQEGFQRILQMLGGNKSRNATPQAEAPHQSRPAPLQISQADLTKGPGSAIPSMRDGPGTQDFVAYAENPPREQDAGLENLLSQKASKEGPTQSRDTEFLLRLMQQSKISQTPTNPQPPHLPSPGGPNMQDVHTRAQEPNDPRDQLRRRVTSGSPGYFDEMPYHQPSGGTPGNPPGIRPQAAPGQPPIAIQRPPGLEQVAPSGWSNQQLQQGSNHPMAPPGLSNAPNRNMNPNFPSGPPMPMSAGMSLPNDRQAPLQRGDSRPSGFGPPPGIVPPPGYVNMNGPPPSGFPPMPHAPENMMGMPHGNPAHYGAPQQGQHHQARQLLDIFSQPGGGPNDGGMGGRNGMGMMGPGGYR